MLVGVACTSVYILVTIVSNQTVNLLYNVCKFLYYFWWKAIYIYIYNMNKVKKMMKYDIPDPRNLPESFGICLFMMPLHKKCQFCKSYLIETSLFFRLNVLRHYSVEWQTPTALLITDLHWNLFTQSWRMSMISYVSYWAGLYVQLRIRHGIQYRISVKS